MIYSLNLLYDIYLQFSGPNLPTILKSYHLATSSHLNNNQVIQNAYKLTSIAKTYVFNSLSEVVFVYMEVLYRLQKEAIGLVYFLIKSLNLSEVQKALKRDSRFKSFTVEYVQDIVKDEMSTIISNPKLSISNSKISPETMETFSILTIDNKHVKNISIL